MAALIALMIGYAILFGVFYPPIAGVEDEVGFLNQALVWSRGSVSAEGAGLGSDLADFIEINGRHVPARHPGRSLLALPFLATGGVATTFISGLLLHLLMTAAGAALLARLGRSPLWAVLLLFHPTLALYSRTIMADGAAGAGLLLAALGIVAGTPIGAGLAVGLAASMRYHAGLALPLVAGTFIFPMDSDDPVPKSQRRRDALICLIAGGAVGLVLVVYNLAVYGSPNEPFTARRGTFSMAFIGPHLIFYASSLMVVWPGMLLTPLLDRSRLRWLLRGLIVIFLGPLLFYYFHDRGPGWLATAVLGQRLIQVALPLWIVGYAGIIDDRLARSLRAALGPRRWTSAVVLGCLGLFMGTGLLFERHQRHLDALRLARDEFVAHVPADALVECSGSIFKIVGTSSGVPRFHLRGLDWMGVPRDTPEALDHALDREPRPWYLAILHRSPGDPLYGYIRDLIDRQGLEPVPLRSDLLRLYVARPGVIGGSP